MARAKLRLTKEDRARLTDLPGGRCQTANPRPKLSVLRGRRESCPSLAAARRPSPSRRTLARTSDCLPISISISICAMQVLFQPLARSGGAAYQRPADPDFARNPYAGGALKLSGVDDELPRVRYHLDSGKAPLRYARPVSSAVAGSSRCSTAAGHRNGE